MLRPLSWLGLLPRAVHERRRVRAMAEHWLKARWGISGYVALHKVPPEHFRWLDLPEREDLFEAREIGGVPTFLSQARDAGLSVYASPWQTPEHRRWSDAHATLRQIVPDLTFLYSAELDAILHREGNGGSKAEEAMDRIARNINLARELLMNDGGELTTFIVGDHGMADIRSTIDSRPTLRLLSNARVFVDATMLRCWGGPDGLKRTSDVIARQGWPGRWLDAEALKACRAPTRGTPYGNALFLLDEGFMFSPSFLGGAASGMHGYALGAASCFAGLASDRPLPSRCSELRDLAGLVRNALNLETENAKSAHNVDAPRLMVE